MLRDCHIIAALALAGLGGLLSAPARANDLIVDPGNPACVSKGDEGGDAVYCTIQAAIDAAYAEGGGKVSVEPGVYPEVLLVRADVEIEGTEEGVIVELPTGAQPAALVTLENDAGLHNLTLRLPEGAGAALPLLLVSGVEDVEIEDLILDGGFNRGSVGVYVQNQLLETSRIRKSELRRLEVGILAEDTRFQITRCLFEDILRDAIYVRPPSAKGEDDGEDFDAPDVGDDEDLEFSGFNRFRNIGGFVDDLGQPINPGDAFLLRNTTGTQLLAQLNDWGIYETANIAAGMGANEPGVKAVTQGTDAVLFEPYIGKSIFPGSVFVRLRDAVTRVSLLNGNPRLRLGASDTGINPAFDASSKLYSFTFVNPDSYNVLGQAPDYLNATRSALVGPGEIVAMDINLTADPDATEGEPAPEFHTGDLDLSGRIGLSELLRVIQIYNSLSLHCQAGTEDGYALGEGLRTCTPHAADYAPQDWSIGFSELLRIIQFYNSPGYYPCPGTEDGYCPGVRV
jgi:hypothetical protein